MSLPPKPVISAFFLFLPALAHAQADDVPEAAPATIVDETQSVETPALEPISGEPAPALQTLATEPTPAATIDATPADTGADWMRISTYVAAGVGVAVLGFGVGGYAWNSDRLAKWEFNRTRRDCVPGGSPAAGFDCTRFDRRKDTIDSFDQLAIASIVTGGVFVTTAAMMLFLGPPPASADATAAEASTDWQGAVSFAPSPEGVFGAVSWRF